MSVAICRFCDRSAVLRKSHILPEFIYRPLYDDKHRAMTLPAHGPSVYLQKGFRASLLCESCEQYFNEQFEKPFRQEFFEKALLPQVAMRRRYKVKINYGAIKLFLLSVLWRAGVCDQSPFELVYLAEHEPEIRRMLRDRDAGGTSTYPIFAFLGLVPDRRVAVPLVVQPYSPGHLEGCRVYVFVFGGCLWHFVLSNGFIPSVVAQNVLKENGTVIIPTVDIWDVEELNQLFVKHFTEAKARREF